MWRSNKGVRVNNLAAGAPMTTANHESPPGALEGLRVLDVAAPLGPLSAVSWGISAPM